MAQPKKKPIAKAKKKAPRAVIVRTFSAGVHYGHLESESADSKRVVLRQSRRIWYWQGAASLSQLAVDGPGAGSKIAVALDSITLTEAIEIIDVTEKARAAIEGYAAWRA